MSIATSVEGLQRLERLEIQAVDVQAWLDNLALAWDHPDPADRRIVALARRRGCGLVRSDRSILDFYPQAVW